MEVNRQLLTDDQRKELDRYTEFFNGPLWRDLVNRYQPVIEAQQGRLTKVDSLVELGRVQGRLDVLYSIFVSLPDLVNYEFLLITGQAGREGLNEDPVDESDWAR